MSDDSVDVDLLQDELAMANGHIDYLRGEVERLQAENGLLKEHAEAYMIGDSK